MTHLPSRTNLSMGLFRCSIMAGWGLTTALIIFFATTSISAYFHRTSYLTFAGVFLSFHYVNSSSSLSKPASQATPTEPKFGTPSRQQLGTHASSIEFGEKVFGPTSPTDTVPGTVPLLGSTASHWMNGLTKEERIIPGARHIIAEVYDLRDDVTTEASLHSALKREVRKLAQELANISLTDQQAERELIWLRKQPSVREKSERLEETEPLTGSQRIIRRITLTVPPTVLEQWSDRLNQRRHVHLWGYVYGSLGTLAIWTIGLLIMGLLDRWTGGYRRFAIVLFGGATLLILTAANWLAVYITYLT